MLDIRLVENDIKRATAQVSKAQEAYNNDPAERNYVTLTIYKNILENLHTALDSTYYNAHGNHIN